MAAAPAGGQEVWGVAGAASSAVIVPVAWVVQCGASSVVVVDRMVTAWRPSRSGGESVTCRCVVPLSVRGSGA